MIYRWLCLFYQNAIRWLQTIDLIIASTLRIFLIKICQKKISFTGPFASKIGRSSRAGRGTDEKAGGTRFQTTITIKCIARVPFRLFAFMLMAKRGFFEPR